MSRHHSRGITLARGGNQPKCAIFISLAANMRLNEKNKNVYFYLQRGGGRGEMAQTIYMHVSKCKNDKIFKNSIGEK
jgi:hypothetical protein